MPDDPSAAEPEAHRLADDGIIPNNPELPLLLYRQALTPSGADPASTFEELFARHGWAGSWRDGIYTFHHYHSTAHEALGIARGRVRVRLGGEGGLRVELAAGDVVVLPAGTGHKNEGASPDLLVVGAYPPGQDWDLCRGEPGERPRVLANIAGVPLPSSDPVHGPNGPLTRLWHADGR
jgi:uncharacterized protein YjlB